MSEIQSDFDKSAAAYWQQVANRSGPGKSEALQKAVNLIRDAAAEAKLPDSATQPTLNQMEAASLSSPQFSVAMGSIKRIR